MTSSDLFQAIAAISQLGMAIAVSVGVYIAFRQVTANRTDQLELKKFELADEMIGLVFEFVDLLDEARSPGELIPWNPDINQTKYVNARIEKVKSTSDLVKSIARLNVRQKAVIQSVKVGDAIDELFEIRYEVFRALLTVRRSYSSPPKTEEALERLHRAEDMMYGTGDQDDEIHVRQQSALSSIQSELAQSLRLGL